MSTRRGARDLQDGDPGRTPPPPPAPSTIRWPALAARSARPTSPVAARLDYAHRKLVKTRHVYIAASEEAGYGIYAARGLARGAVIVEDEDGDYYEGAVSEAAVRALGLDLSQHCFQVGHDLYLLPHGSIDDLINHSCSPNAGIQLTPHGYRLVALADIGADEQITYDYSTYISNPRERLICACGSSACRRDIGPFAELPIDLQAYYLDLGVVGLFAAEGGSGAD